MIKRNNLILGIHCGHDATAALIDEKGNVVTLDIKSRKGTFKLVQYMAMGVVSVSSYMTYCEKLIQDGSSGFLVYTEDEWVEKLLQALRLPREKMNEMNNKAYETYLEKHHVANQVNKLISYYYSLFNL